VALAHTLRVIIPPVAKIDHHHYHHEPMTSDALLVYEIDMA
jgi:hypothetical protein